MYDVLLNTVIPCLHFVIWTVCRWGRSADGDRVCKTRVSFGLFRDVGGYNYADAQCRYHAADCLGNGAFECRGYHSSRLGGAQCACDFRRSRCAQNISQNYRLWTCCGKLQSLTRHNCTCTTAHTLYVARGVEKRQVLAIQRRLGLRRHILVLLTLFPPNSLSLSPARSLSLARALLCSRALSRALSHAYLSSFRCL